MNKQASLHDHKVIFVHIPKTAGTTLNAIIERNYPPSARFSLGPVAQKEIARFKSLSQTERAQIQILHGHLAYGLHDYMVGPTAYFTLLREPIERMLSFHFFVKRNPQHYLYDFTRQHEDGIMAHLEKKVTIMFDNFQTRFISGVWDEYPNGELPAHVLEKAKYNLREKFAVFGLTEAFDETLLLLQKTLGWKHIYYTRRNVTANRPGPSSLDPATLTALRRANQMDLDLYTYAQDLFATRLERQGPSFPWEVRSFRLKNQFIVSPLLANAARLRQFSLRVFIRQQLRRLYSDN